MTASNQTFGYRIAILTISDKGAKGEREDLSGNVVAERVLALGFQQIIRDIVPDEKEFIAGKMKEWTDGGEIDLIISTGGTGLGPRDVTPEAVRSICDFEIPGVGEAIRSGTLKYTQMAMLSRSTAGVRNGCLIITLPGSPKGVRECLEVIEPVLVHAMDITRGRKGHPSH